MTCRTYTNRRGEIWVGCYYRLPADDHGKQKVIPLGWDLIEAKRRAELEGQPRPRDVRLLGFIFDRYEREVTPQKAPRTQFDDRQRLKPLRAVFADLSIDALTPQVIRKYLDGRSAKVRANREIALLSAIFNRAREWGYTDRPNPVQGGDSSRPWCRREVLEAKRFGAHILIVDALEGGDPRSFPYGGNVPIIRWQFRDPQVDARRVLDRAVLEALRFKHNRAVLDTAAEPGEIVLPAAPEAVSG